MKHHTDKFLLPRVSKDKINEILRTSPMNYASGIGYDVNSLEAIVRTAEAIALAFSKGKLWEE